MTSFRINEHLPVNEKYTGKKLTKEVLGDELEGYFISSKTIN